MTGGAWATMIVICGFVWGGFFGLVVFAMRKERFQRDRDGT